MSIPETLGYCRKCKKPAEIYDGYCLFCRAEAGPGPNEATPWRAASEVEPEEIDWLWHPRIAVGKMTMIVGDPGLGKSQLTCALAADISRGRVYVDGAPGSPGDVLMASFEDGPGDTIRPRLDKQGADLSRVFLLDQWKDSYGRPRSFLNSDVPVLESSLRHLAAPKLLIVDPLMAFIGAGTDTNKDNEVRGALQSLVEMALRQRIAVVVVAHLNKGELTNVLYKISGSVGFVALSRSVCMVGQDGESGKRGFLHIKNNIGPLAPPITFSIDNSGFHWGQVDESLTPEGMFKTPDGRKRRREHEEVADWLRRSLANGPRSSSEMKAEAEEIGYALRTVNRVRADIGVKSEHEIDENGKKLPSWQWVWTGKLQEEES